MNNQTHSQKSPYIRGDSSARGRGTLLAITVVILLFAAGAWVASFTRAVETQPVGGAGQMIDPGASVPPAATKGKN